MSRELGDVGPGDTFGRWTVLRRTWCRVGAERRSAFACRCRCGVERRLAWRDLRDGRSTGCPSAECRRAFEADQRASEAVEELLAEVRGALAARGVPAVVVDDALEQARKRALG